MKKSFLRSFANIHPDMSDHFMPSRNHCTQSLTKKLEINVDENQLSFKIADSYSFYQDQFPKEVML